MYTYLPLRGRTFMGRLGGILLLIYADGRAIIIHLITAALSFQLDNTLRSEGIAIYKCAKFFLTL